MSGLPNLARLQAEATPGPWHWFGNRSLPIYLATPKGGRRFVMTFEATACGSDEDVRADAQPLFQVYSDREGAPWTWNGRMTPASELAVCPKTYRDDIADIDHPDAALIAAAPEMAALLQECAEYIQRDVIASASIPKRETLLARLAEFDATLGDSSQ